MTKNVYQCISEVSAALAAEGIGKNRQADTFGDKEGGKKGFKFRGIDDVHNALARPLSDVGLVVLPRVKKRTVIERTSKYGGALFSVSVQVEYTLASSHDGSTTNVAFIGEAMDSGDKATNKAMSIAYKYMAIQTFCIPVVGIDDPDETIHEVAPSRPQQSRDMKRPPPKEQPKPPKRTPEPTSAPKPAPQKPAQAVPQNTPDCAAADKVVDSLAALLKWEAGLIWSDLHGIGVERGAWTEDQLGVMRRAYGHVKTGKTPELGWDAARAYLEENWHK